MRTSARAKYSGSRRWKELLMAGVASVALLASGFTAAGAPVASATPESSNGEEPIAAQSVEELDGALLEDPEDGADTSLGMPGDSSDEELQADTPDAVTQNRSLSYGTKDAPSKHEYLNLNKQVDGLDKRELKPGDAFTYTWQVSISEKSGQTGITLIDELPDLSTFEVIKVRDGGALLAPDGLAVAPHTPFTVTWFNGEGEPYENAPDILAKGDSFRVDLPGTWNVGQTVTFSLQLKVPESFSPEDPRNGRDKQHDLVNVATVESDQSAPVESSAIVNVQTNVKPDVSLVKTWLTTDGKGTQSFQPGAQSVINLKATNKWNVGIDKLIVTDPAPGSAKTPFNSFNFVAFGSVTLPDGADQVQAEVFNGTAWVPGPVGATPQLPDGFQPTDVEGVRLTFSNPQGGDNRIAVGATADVNIVVEQRTQNRDGSTTDLSLGYDAQNEAHVEAAREGYDSATGKNDATFKIKPVQLGVTVAKSFDPAELSKGQESVGTITATNGSAPVHEMTVEDVNGFFDGTVFDSGTTWVRQFDGFTTVGFPEGAQTAKITYTFDDNSECTTDSFGSLDSAPGPCKAGMTNANVTGFKFVFTGAANENSIVGGAEAVIKFKVSTNKDAKEGNTDNYIKKTTGSTFQGWQKTNKAKAKVEAVNGSKANDQTEADLRVIDPWIDVNIEKSILPNTAVLPGQSVIAKLDTTAKTSNGTKVTKLEITDEWGGNKSSCSVGGMDFWDAFNMTSIRPTQVHDGYTLQVQVNTGSGYTNLTDGYKSGPGFFQMDESVFATAVGTPSNVVGVKFVYTYIGTNLDNASEDFQVMPYVGFTARKDLRTTSDGTNCELPKTDGNNVLSFNNVALANGEGTPPNGGETVKDDDKDVEPGKVVNPQQPGPNPGMFLDKRWDRNWVLEFSRDSQRYTELRWGVNEGYGKVVIGDPTGADAGPGDVKATVFDAFNLTGIRQIADDSNAYSNGWFLRYDKITKVELYDGNGWVPATEPSGGWQLTQTIGAVPYPVGLRVVTLSAEQQKTTQAVRVTLEPNDKRRTAAQNPENGAFDPFAPKPDTGIASGGGTGQSYRFFQLNWELRDTTRSGDPVWVTHDGTFNAGKPTVSNDVDLAATPLGAEDSVTLRAKDNILILGTKPALSVTKTVAPSSVVVPDPNAGIDPTKYPTVKYTVTAQNTAGSYVGGVEKPSGVSRAQWIRVADPNFANAIDNTAGQDVNPWKVAALNDGLFASGKVLEPFNWLNITELKLNESKSGEVDFTKSHVFLLYYNDGNFTTGKGTINPDLTVSPGSGNTLADVVGFAVTFVSKDTSKEPSGAGGGGAITGGNKLSVTVNAQVRDTYRVSADGKTQVEAGKKVTVNNSVAGLLTRADGKTADGSANINLDLLGEKLDVAPTKTITPGTVNEPERDEPVSVTLKANQGEGSNASPKKVVLEDHRYSSGFWGVVNLAKIESITFPAGADRVQIDAHKRDGDWDTGSPQTDTDWSLPSGVALDQIDGLRFTFTRDDRKVFDPDNKPAWSAEVKLSFQLKDNLDFPQENLNNRLYAQSWGVNANSDEKFSDAPLNLSAGTRILDIGKLSNDGVRQVKGGSTTPWDIVAKNVGTGYLDLTSITDIYPEELLYTGTRPGGFPSIEYTNLAGGTVSEPEVQLADGKVIFDWTNAEKRRLAPGEQVEIRLWLQIEASAAIPVPDEKDPSKLVPKKIENDVEILTDNHLDRLGRFEFYRNDKPVGQPDNVQENDDDNGGTTQDVISVTDELAVQITKGVRGPESGFVSGAINWSNPESPCPTFVGNDGLRYYPSPCVANSQQGKDDQWVLRIANAGGRENFNDFWVFDALPKPNDLRIVSGDPRGSQFRPVLVGMPTIVPNPVMEDSGIDFEKDVVLQVTTSDVQVCKNTWGVLKDVPDPHDDSFKGACGQNGEVWHNADAFEANGGKWEEVTGIRVEYHNDSHTTKFGNGWVADIVYSTRNVIKNDAFPEGAGNVIPVDRDEVAWNQFGVAFLARVGEGANDRLAGLDVGTHLLNGSIQVEKKVEGVAAKYAPDTFTATVSCEVPGGEGAEATPLFFADESAEGDKSLTKTVELKKNAEGTYDPVRIHGIPVEAECTVTEDGDLGHFGEIQRDPESETLTVAVPDTEWDDETVLPTNEVPEAQISTITNTYNWSGLSITKNVVTEADKGTFGPFQFELSCVTSDQSHTDEDGNVIPVPVEFDGGAKKVTFTLKDKETWNAPENTIPWGSTCTLVETNKDGADKTVITGDNVAQNEDGSATIKVTGTEKDPAAVVSTLVDNHYPAGTFTVEKAVAGAGAEKYGTATFSFKATCEYKSESLLDETFDLKAGEEKSFGVFPAGTTCEVVETKTGGATSPTMSPAGGKITIEGPKAVEGEETTPPVGSVTVTATNQFDVGSLKINKVRDGAGAEQYGAGPFEAKVACTYDVDGVKTDIALANGGKVVLSADNKYTATIDNLIVGAQCSVVETDEAGAHSVALAPENGMVTIGASGSTVEATITNTFNTGSVKIQKVVDGSAAQYGVGPFEAKMACTYDVNGETRDVALANGGVAVLSEDNGYTARFDGVYVGAECSIVETEVAGAHATAITPNNGVVTVSESEQVVDVTITNTFNAGDVSVTKKVSTEADKGTFGPFDFELSCVTTQDQKVLFPVEGDETSETAKFTLGRDETWDAPKDTIPVGSTCTLVETLNGGADKTAITGDNVTQNEDGSATFVVRGEDSTTALISTLVDNHFPAGTLSVTKVVDGSGAEAYGAGEFGFSAVCEYNKSKVLDETFTLKHGETASFGVFPAGTICTVLETDAAGAHASVLDPEDGVVTIIGPVEGEDGVTPVVGTVSVTATNTFNTGDLEIIKQIEGAYKAERGLGPYEAQVSCEYTVDGKKVDVELENSGKVTLSRDNGYRAKITGIYAGADCTVVETKDGGADRTDIGPDGGKVVIETDKTASVTIINHFDDPANPDPFPEDPNNGKKPNGGLSKTGAQVAGVALVAAALLGVGALFLGSNRRRKPGKHRA